MGATYNNELSRQVKLRKDHMAAAVSALKRFTAAHAATAMCLRKTSSALRCYVAAYGLDTFVADIKMQVEQKPTNLDDEEEEESMEFNFMTELGSFIFSSWWRQKVKKPEIVELLGMTLIEDLNDHFLRASETGEGVYDLLEGRRRCADNRDIL
ncbi:hypothetical protein Tsubulata_012032 [Turnera subulata]|uniref:Uncharacterized protein n=1 Tax=Turnera subulata TaxID=218843 RepID=A0A9Q0JQU3_9ROSI|nr:hypothetical protein Tsubulata_012032 [Turnera subulata]